MAEIWDVYDSDFNKQENRTQTRGQPIPAGVYHLVGEVVVRHTDGTYLLMQRDTVKHNGGKWELSACGSAFKGETALECAKRELWEETGIHAEKLLEIGKVVMNAHHAIYVDFLCIVDGAKDQIVLQKGETMAYQWVDRDTLFAMGDEVVSVRSLLFAKEQIV